MRYNCSYQEGGFCMEQIGTRMKELREASHLSQAKIALLCGIGQATIAKAEKGRILPSLKLLIWWADYFDVSLDYLCCRTDQPQGRQYQCKPRMNISGDDMRQFVEMCFDPQSSLNGKLKEALLSIMEDDTK